MPTTAWTGEGRQQLKGIEHIQHLLQKHAYLVGVEGQGGDLFCILKKMQVCGVGTSPILQIRRLKFGEGS